jgi:hypothetical protein
VCWGSWRKWDRNTSLIVRHARVIVAGIQGLCIIKMNIMPAGFSGHDVFRIEWIPAKYARE